MFAASGKKLWIPVALATPPPQVYLRLMRAAEKTPETLVLTLTRQRTALRAAWRHQCVTSASTRFRLVEPTRPRHHRHFVPPF
jgi:hypothetical protein